MIYPTGGDWLRMEIAGGRVRSVSDESTWEEPVPRSRKTWALIVVALLLVAAAGLAAPSVPGAVKEGSDLLSQLVSSFGGSSGGSGSLGLNYTIYSPLIEGGTANITYPSNYGALASYALQLINDDRGNYSLAPVNMTTGEYAQQHADSMLKYGYFSHNDTQGYKPYMRYTLLGGTGAVEENIAFAYSGSPIFTSTSSIEQELSALEWTMMYNDSICCNNGHRDNILNSLHNEVSIGVAFNSTSLYFVEDFVSYYINLNFSVSRDYYVNMTGVPTIQGLSPDAIYITYDHTPIPETPAQLNAGPHEYSAGTLVGGVLPPCDLACQTFDDVITVHADVWTFTATNAEVAFSLAKFIEEDGPGVYTVYLVLGSDTTSAITSISVFVQ